MLYLASRSPRRLGLLRQLGVEFEILDCEIDETWDGAEAALDYVIRMADEKAIKARQVIDNPEPSILAADTVVVINSEILGKPANTGQATTMLDKLSGQTHQVYTALAYSTTSKLETILSKNSVRFKILTDEEIDTYVNIGESLDKAGAYAIQGRAAAFIIEVKGSYSGIMGLPLKETRELLNFV